MVMDVDVEGGKRESLPFDNFPCDQFAEYPEQDNVEPTENRPSILITFQNSASYYTSYMGGQGGRGPQGNRRKNSEVMDPPIQPNQHPIVVMNEYPNPGPVLVAVNSRKQSYDRSYNPFINPPPSTTSSPASSSGFPGPGLMTGPPGPPGPPTPNLPPSRRSSMNMNSSTLELPKKRRTSMTPRISTTSLGRNSPSDRLLASNSGRNSPIDRLLASNSRLTLPSSLPGSRPPSRASNYDTSSLPRGTKLRPPVNSQSMPTLNEIADCEFEEPQPSRDPSPRPSVCSSAMTESQAERRPLVSENIFQRSEDEWNPHQKPNWLSLNLDEERDKPRARSRSVYVAEIWPSLVCILTAVLVTLTIYLLISYLYSQPIPNNTRTRILPAQPNFKQPPGYDMAGYPPPYPYNPVPYERYPQAYPQNLAQQPPPEP